MKPKCHCAKSIFIAAINEHTPEVWPEFLDDACGDNTELRARVDKLLKAHVAMDTLDRSETAAATVVQAVTEPLGSTIGPYKLREPLGEGGMGIVFLAEQDEPIRRTVALKLIKAGMDTKNVTARFEAERQALALMDHPNIAHVLDGGSTESGRPYFVMELVDGTRITEFCDDCRYTTRQRLELFVQVCQAVQHAHQKGIIHRDSVIWMTNRWKPVRRQRFIDSRSLLAETGWCWARG